MEIHSKERFQEERVDTCVGCVRVESDEHEAGPLGSGDTDETWYL